MTAEKKDGPDMVDVDLEDIQVDAPKEPTKEPTKDETKKEAEKKEGKKEALPKVVPIPFGDFFKYLTGKEKVLYYVGYLAGIIAGAIVPALGIIIGGITTSYDPDKTDTDINKGMLKMFISCQILGVCVWAFSYMYYAFWQHLAENITFDLRKRYIKALLT
jgi:hypothetical protein